MEQVRVQKLLDGFKNGAASREVSTQTEGTQTEGASIVEPKRTDGKSVQTEGEVTNYSRFFEAVLDNLTMLNNKVENNSKLLEKLVPVKQFSFNNETLFDDYSPTPNPPVMSPINNSPFIDSLQEVLSLRPPENLNATSSVPPHSESLIPGTSLPPPSNPTTSPSTVF